MICLFGAHNDCKYMNGIEQASDYLYIIVFVFSLLLVNGLFLLYLKKKSSSYWALNCLFSLHIIDFNLCILKMYPNSNTQENRW